MKQKCVVTLFLLLSIILLAACAKEAQIQKDDTKTTGPSTSVIVLKTDSESIGAGRILFMQKCEPCHDPYSTMTLSGPGLQGILKNPFLPVSKKPATPENIANQMRHPLSSMPSFVYLDEGDVENIIAFLNTL